MKRQEEQVASRRIQQEAEFSKVASEAPIERRVGEKSKREDDNDDVEREEDQTAGIMAGRFFCVCAFIGYYGLHQKLVFGCVYSSCVSLWFYDLEIMEKVFTSIYKPIQTISIK